MRLVVGVIGHVDHGKTALVRSLTGEDTDRLAEEKRRGISIALGFAHLRAGPVDIDLIDMPGHERFVRTMISGATGLDAVLLAVAANEGVKPETVEHVDIAGLVGLRRAIVAVTKIDLVEPAVARRVAQDALQLLARAGLEPLPPVMTSVTQEQGMTELRAALEAMARRQVPRAADGLAFLPIDRAFSVPGHGPVVTGTLRGAAVEVGGTLELLPARRPVRVRAVQVHGASTPQAMPGQRVALNLRDVDRRELQPGMAVAAPGALAPCDWLTVALRTVPGAPPLKNGMRLRALLGTDECDIRLRLLDTDQLDAGRHGFAQLHCAHALAVPAGEPVVLRLASPPRTVAGGRIIEPETRRLRRKSARILERLEDLRSLPPAAMIASEVEHAGAGGTSVRHLSRLSALAEPGVVERLRSIAVVVTRSGSVMRQIDVDRLSTQIPRLLGVHAAGLAHDKLLAALPGTGVAVLDKALEGLLAAGAVCKRGGQFLVPRPEEERGRARLEGDLAARIAQVLCLGGLTPPDPGALMTDLASKRAVDRLLREGIIVRATDRAKNKEMLFHRDAIEDAQRRLAPLLERTPGLSVSEVGTALGVSRKYSMPLLGHLDAIRFTRRIDDRRIRGQGAVGEANAAGRG